jgi:hypothetical protein
MLLCVAPAEADPAGPDGRSFLLFAGTDLWRDGAFLHGDLLWSPGGGAQMAVDVWYQPTPASMAAINGTIASIAAIGTMRAAVGWRFDQPFFVGPEAQALWCLDYQQWRLGAHVTGFRIDGLDWSASAGWAIESIGRAGPYLRLGVNTRF